jgi:hypothetical protein
VRRSVIAAAAAVGILAAGCGTVTSPSYAHRARAAAPARTGPRGRAATAAGNRAAAQREAARLLALAPLPPGATRLARPPAGLSAAAGGVPGVTSLVDRETSWRVPLSFPALQAWVTAHPPRGLPRDGESTSWSGGLIDMAGFTYRGPAGAAWQSAELEIGTAPLGPHASALRADAVLVWLDPRPVRSAPGPHPVRVTLAGGCPPTDVGVTGVVNPGARLSQRLLPPGQPAGGLLCRYDGRNGRPWRLVRAGRLTAAAAWAAAAPMTRLPLSHPDGAMISCPMDDGSAEVLALAYPGGPDIDLWITLNGCRTVSNGYISAGIP